MSLVVVDTTDVTCGFLFPLSFVLSLPHSLSLSLHPQRPVNVASSLRFRAWR